MAVNAKENYSFFKDRVIGHHEEIEQFAAIQQQHQVERQQAEIRRFAAHNELRALECLRQAEILQKAAEKLEYTLVINIDTKGINKIAPHQLQMIEDEISTLRHQALILREESDRFARRCEEALEFAQSLANEIEFRP